MTVNTTLSPPPPPAFEQARNIISGFLEDYQKSIDSMKEQLDLIEEQKKTLLTEIETGYKNTVLKDGSTINNPLDTLEKLQLRRETRMLESQKTEIWEKIITLSRQTQAVEILKMIDKKLLVVPDGNLQKIDNKKETKKETSSLSVPQPPPSPT